MCSDSCEADILQFMRYDTVSNVTTSPGLIACLDRQRLARSPLLGTISIAVSAAA
jgi:hypothetical protein